MKNCIHTKAEYLQHLYSSASLLQKLETVQMSLSWGMNKQTAAHSHSRLELSNKMEGTIDMCNYMEGSLRTLCWVKEARLKRLHTVWFHLYTILEKAKQGQKTHQWLLVVKGRGEIWLQQGSMREFGGTMELLYLDCGGYTTLCIWQNSELYIPRSEFYCMSTET